MSPICSFGPVTQSQSIKTVEFQVCPKQLRQTLNLLAGSMLGSGDQVLEVYVLQVVIEIHTLEMPLGTYKVRKISRPRVLTLYATQVVVLFNSFVPNSFTFVSFFTRRESNRGLPGCRNYHQPIQIVIFLKNGPTRASFSFICGLFKQTIQFYNKVI